jgi:serine/threonine-protein kinase HipA
MTSKSCYVYIQLPGLFTPVTCGKFEREILRDGGAVGRFVYGKSYRSRLDAVPIDPYHLPLAKEQYEAVKLGGIFGALRDASPDAWGRRIIENFQGRTDLDEMDYLLLAPEDRVGALSFGRGQSPPAPVQRFNRILQLAELRSAAETLGSISAGEPVPLQIQQLADPGSSLGGARPKNVVEDDTGLWIAKFPQRGDRWNYAAVEAGMTTLAARCGIRVPEIRIELVSGGHIFLVKRFDRERTPKGYRRHRFVSALTVLDAEDAISERTNWSYLLLADELQRWSLQPAADKVELFRRVVFNALISNTDDHPRNHALVAPGKDWRLAPAYDLTPTPSHSIELRNLALECGVFGRMARRDNLLSGAARFGLDRQAASAIIDHIYQVVAGGWSAEVRRHGATQQDCTAIAPAFTYAGFEYPTPPDS